MGPKDIPFCTVTRLTPGPTQPPSHWVVGAPLPGVNQAGCEADHLNVVLRLTVSGTIAPLPLYAFMAGTGNRFTSFAFCMFAELNNRWYVDSLDVD